MLVVMKQSAEGGRVYILDRIICLVHGLPRAPLLLAVNVLVVHEAVESSHVLQRVLPKFNVVRISQDDVPSVACTVRSGAEPLHR